MENPRYKDTVFRDLFGSEERKHYTLSLYNALAGTAYDDPDAIEITTLGDVLYLNVKNDVSFIIDDEMTLWEHQSTYNPNMPLRGLIYFSRLYEKYVETHSMNMYGSKLLKLPRPRYVVFYIGKADRPEREMLRLSDSTGDDDPSVEVKAIMVNINANKNPELLSACEALSGYSALVAKVRERVRMGNALGDAVTESVDECIGDGILKEYLIAKKSEVIAMFMTEYDEDKVREMFRQDGLEEGRAEGRAEGALATAATLVRKGLVPLREAADELGIAEEELRSTLEAQDAAAS